MKTRATLINAIGTALSFVAALGSLFIVARIYGPSDFGLLAEFLAWLSIPCAVASLRISDAIPLTKTPDSEGIVVRGALESTILTALLAAVIMTVVRYTALQAIPVHTLIITSIALVGATSLHRIGVMILTKRGRFVLLALVNVALPTATALGQLTAYGAGWSLCSGTVLGISVAASMAIPLVLGVLTRSQVSGFCLGKAIRAFPEFPKLATPFSVLVTFRLRLPYMLIGLPQSSLGPSVAGALQQADRVASWPNSALTAVLRPVFHHAATSCAISAAKQSLSTSTWVLMTCVGPATWIALNAHSIAEVLLGPEWVLAGKLMAALVLPQAVFAAVAFNDRLYEMLRRQSVLVAIEGTAAGLTACASIVFAIYAPSIEALVACLASLTICYAGAQYLGICIIVKQPAKRAVLPLAVATLICLLVMLGQYAGRPIGLSVLWSAGAAVACSLSVLVAYRRRSAPVCYPKD